MANYTDVEGDKIQSAVQSNLTALLEEIEDPRGRINTSNLVYQADPRTKSADFSDYPIIYIEHYGVTDDSTNVGGNLFNMSFNAEIHVVAADESAQQKKWHDDVSDQLSYLFRYGSRGELADHNISQPSINRNQRFTGIDVADQPVIRREVEVTAGMQIDMDEVTQ